MPAFQVIWHDTLDVTTGRNETAARRARYLSARDGADARRDRFSSVPQQFSEPLWLLFARRAAAARLVRRSRNLLLARKRRRQRELAVRLAIGASRAVSSVNARGGTPARDRRRNRRSGSRSGRRILLVRSVVDRRAAGHYERRARLARPDLHVAGGVRDRAPLHHRARRSEACASIRRVIRTRAAVGPGAASRGRHAWLVRHAVGFRP